ncbi:DUF502 domain-containing protein [Candidatus Nanohalobium constans]|uniref:Putative membrane protein n=1 Tax=Candidatus Nanohalobium constans TaxID=2565781 RepID=A0A5Q0UFK5_9ARCH|nr:DUF502 domain-containing protein [Candidatus Nanohalobium constans]QGA79970.1 putative membrane protein [Candidatus Nanohalobium constans]
MGEEREKNTQNHFREGRKHLEKGTQKMLEQGIEKGREQRKKLEYYQQNRSEFITNLSARLGNPKKPAVSGTIVLLPVLAVLIVVSWLFDKLAAIPGNHYFNIAILFPDFIANNGVAAYYLNQTFKLSILLIFGGFIVTAVGRIVRTQQGFQLEKLLDKVFDRIPFLGSVYNITKVTTETMLGSTEDLSKPVKINHGDIRINGFKTGNKTEDGREIIFMPTAPNITSGLVLELPDDKIEETDETGEEALTRILSAGFGQKKEEKPPEGEENQ